MRGCYTPFRERASVGKLRACATVCALMNWGGVMAWKLTYAGEIISNALSDEQCNALRNGIEEALTEGSGWLSFDDLDGFTRHILITPGVGVILEQFRAPSRQVRLS